MLALYLFYTFIILYIFAILCAKIYSPFWFHQPAYHICELYPRIRSLWDKSPYWKRNRPPKEGVFCNTKNILTFSYSEISNTLVHDLCSFLQGHYVDTNYSLFYCDETFLSNIHLNDSMVSFYFDTILKPELEWKEIINNKEIYGSITSRPFMISFSRFPQKNTILHFLDFICIHEKFQKKNLSRNMIQTHIYQHGLLEKTPKGYMFHKQGSLCKGIVPLIQYDTYTFVLRDTSMHKLPTNYRIKCLNKTNIDLWRVIYYQMVSQYEIVAIPEIQYTIDWLTNERYVIYVSSYIYEKVEHVHGVYFFENANIGWDTSLKKPKVVRLAGSMIFHKHNHDNNNVLFFRCFLHSLKQYLLDKKEHGILEIPCFGDSDIILAKWQEKYELRNQTTCAYYLYNILYPSSPIKPCNFQCLL